MGFDALQRYIDRKILESSADRLKQSARKEVDYRAIEDQKKAFLDLLDAKRILQEMREAQKVQVEVETEEARKQIESLFDIFK